MSIEMWVLYMWAMILLIEIVSGRHRGVYKLNDWLATGGCVLFGQLTRPVASVLYASLFGLLLPAYKGTLSGLPLLPSVIVLFLISEFAFYWVHRLAHNPVRHKLLFGLHRTHHSARYLNLTVMARVNIFWGFVVPYAWVLGTAVYLGLGTAAGIVLTALTAWNVFTHSAFRWDDVLQKSRWGRRLLRGIEMVLITPRLHHAHHGWGKNGKTYRNYCVMTTLWDRLFGTLFVPEGRPANYGLPMPDKHWTEEVFFPLVWRRRAKSAVSAQ